MAINTGPLRLCQVAKATNGGIGAPCALRGFVSVAGNWGEFGAAAPIETDR